jgi:hypothetical protein
VHTVSFSPPPALPVISSPLAVLPFPLQLEQMPVFVLASQQLLGDCYILYTSEDHCKALELPFPSLSLVEQLAREELSLFWKPSSFWLVGPLYHFQVFLGHVYLVHAVPLGFCSESDTSV